MFSDDILFLKTVEADELDRQVLMLRMYIS